MQHQVVVEMRTLPMFELAERACRNVSGLETMSGMEVWKILKHTVPVNIRGKRRKRWVLRGPTAESPCLLTVFYETRASLANIPSDIICHYVLPFLRGKEVCRLCCSSQWMRGLILKMSVSVVKLLQRNILFQLMQKMVVEKKRVALDPLDGNAARYFSRISHGDILAVFRAVNVWQHTSPPSLSEAFSKAFFALLLIAYMGEMEKRDSWFAARIANIIHLPGKKVIRQMNAHIFLAYDSGGTDMSERLRSIDLIDLPRKIADKLEALTCAVVDDPHFLCNDSQPVQDVASATQRLLHSFLLMRKRDYRWRNLSDAANDLEKAASIFSGLRKKQWKPRAFSAALRQTQRACDALDGHDSTVAHRRSVNSIEMQFHKVRARRHSSQSK